MNNSMLPAIPTLDPRAALSAFNAQSLTPTQPTATVPATSNSSFSARLSTTISNQQAPTETRTQASRFVAMALVEPVLKQLREPLFEMPAAFQPGAHEKTFRAFADRAFADKLTQSQQWPLIDAVARQLERANPYQEQRP